MTRPIAYFIGGPLDLTKVAVERADTTMYALARSALTLSEVHREQDASRAIDLIRNRHRYRMMGRAAVAEIRESVFVYGYDGLEMDGPWNNKP